VSPQADINFERELWETAVTLRGTVAPADYKHYVLPLLFLRYLSLRYEQRHQQLELLLRDERSDYYTGDPVVDRQILEDPVEYESHNVLVVPDEASWDFIRRHARAGDIKLRLDNAMKLLEERHPAKLQGVLPRIYANSALEVDQVAGLITLFSKDVFGRRDGVDLLGRTYEYFIGNFASSEGTRGGEFFTPLQHRALAGGDAGANVRQGYTTRPAARAACSCSRRASPPAARLFPSTARSASRPPGGWGA
jgi:type I restriction enzyme M protein